MTYTVIVPDEIERIVSKKLKNKEPINRFYKKLKKLEKEPTVYGKPLRKPLAGIWRFILRKDEEFYLRHMINKKLCSLLVLSTRMKCNLLCLLN